MLHESGALTTPPLIDSFRHASQHILFLSPPITLRRLGLKIGGASAQIPLSILDLGSDNHQRMRHQLAVRPRDEVEHAQGLSKIFQY